MKKLLFSITSLCLAIVCIFAIKNNYFGFQNSDALQQENSKNNYTVTTINNNYKDTLYEEFYTKSYFEKRNVIKLDNNNIEKFTNNIDDLLFAKNSIGYVNKENLKTHLKIGNTKLESKLNLDNLITISLETILDKNNNIQFKYFTVKTNDKVKVLNYDISISGDTAFDLNKYSVNQIIGSIKIDISQLDSEFKQIIKEYSLIHDKELSLDKDILQIYITELTNELKPNDYYNM